MQSAKHSPDGLNAMMRGLGFHWQKDPIPHYYHDNGLLRFPVGGTFNIWFDNRLQQQMAVKNRQAYVANRLVIEVEGWKESFPDNFIVWQKAQINMSKHGVIGFQAVFTPLIKRKFTRSSDDFYHPHPELENLPQQYLIDAVALLPPGHTEILSPFHIRFEAATQDVRPYFDPPIINIDEEKDRMAQTMETNDLYYLTHAEENTDLFEEAIEETKNQQETILDGYRLGPFMEKNFPPKGLDTAE